MRYFRMTNPIYVFTGAHITGLGATIAQGDDFKSAKPVAFHLELQLKHKQATLRFI